MTRHRWSTHISNRFVGDRLQRYRIDEYDAMFLGRGRVRFISFVYHTAGDGAFAITLETFIPIFRSFFRRNRVLKPLVSRVACTHNTETKRRSNPANRVVPITVRTGSCTYDFASEMKFI